MPHRATTLGDLRVMHVGTAMRRADSSRMRASSAARIAAHYRKHIEPGLGGARARLERVTPQAVELWHSKLTKKAGPAAANQAAKTLRAGWHLAERFELVPAGSNPVRHFRHFKNPDRARDHVFTPDEWARLERRLWAYAVELVGTPAQNRMAAAALLLMLTGARKNEILGLRWGELDQERRTAHLKHHKTDASSGPKAIYLPPRASELLRHLELLQFYGRAPAARARIFPTDSLQDFFQKVKAELGIERGTIHDLRRTFSSRLANAGVAPEDVAKLLGQKTIRVNTDHYRKLSEHRLRELAAFQG